MLADKLKTYAFLQGLLIGMCLWGCISIGLRWIHYNYGVGIPKSMMAPGRVLYPLYTDEEKKAWDEKRKKEHPIESTWDKIKESISFVSNMVTIFVPIFSGIGSVVVWQKQKMILSELGNESSGRAPPKQPPPPPKKAIDKKSRRRSKS